MKNNYSVFLIDTNEIDNFIHQRVFKYFSECINVLTFSCGAEALEYLKKNKIVPQYILLSLSFPVDNGFDFLEQLQKLNLDKSDTSIYILSTLFLPSDIEKLKRDYNYLGYIEKPLTVEKLFEAMNLRHLEEEIQTKT